MDAAAANTSAGSGSPVRAGYRRSAGAPRREARRRELLRRGTDDLAVNGLGEFSLRRAARAARPPPQVALLPFLSAALTSGNPTGVEAGFEALTRALDREEAAGL